jgi:hypothetical protein
MAPLIVGLGYDWVVEQTGKCVTELIDLARPDVGAKAQRKAQRQAVLPMGNRPMFTPPPLTITCGSGDNLNHLADGSVDVVEGTHRITTMSCTPNFRTTSKSG